MILVQFNWVKKMYESCVNRDICSTPRVAKCSANINPHTRANTPVTLLRNLLRCAVLLTVVFKIIHSFLENNILF